MPIEHDSIALRICTRCKAEKPATLEWFTRRTLEKSGLSSACKECEYAAKRISRMKHHDKILASRKIYYINHREKIRKSHLSYLAAHKIERKNYMRAYRKANPEKARIYTQRHKARKLNAKINDFTSAQWKAMQEQYGYRCVYCNKRYKGHLTQDHITPLIQGGNHTMSNIVPACQPCNSKKHIKSPPVPVQPLLLIGL